MLAFASLLILILALAFSPSNPVQAAQSRSVRRSYRDVAPRAALSSPSAVDTSGWPPLSENVRRTLLNSHPSTYTVAKRSPVPIQDAAAYSHRNGLVTTCDKTGTIAWSNDDGVYTWNKEAWTNMKNAGGKMTFAVNGYNWACIYDQSSVTRLRDAYESGVAEIISHTWSHPHLTDLSWQEIDQQVELLEEALWKIIGVVPAIIRPPYGSINDSIVKYLNDKWGYTVVTWDEDTGDSMGTSAKNSIAEMKQVAKDYPKPHIVLAHESYQSTVEQVEPAALSAFKSAGYKLNSIVDCLNGVSAYKAIGSYGTRDSSWTCQGTPAPGADD